MKNKVKIQHLSHQDWEKERNNGIGSSEAAALLNESKYSSAYKLWRLKVGLDEPIKETWVMRRGHVYEILIQEDFEKETGIKVIKASTGDWLAIDSDKPFLRVSPDRTFWLPNMPHSNNNKGILECKSTMLDIRKDNWKEVHLDWYVQIQYQLHVMRYTTAYLGCMNVNTGESFFDLVKYDKELCENTIVPTIEKFWNECILPARVWFKKHGDCEELHQFAPAITDSSDVLVRYPVADDTKRLKADDITIKLTDENGEEKEYSCYDALDICRSYVSTAKAYTDKADEIKDQLKLAMADAESIVGMDDKALVTFRNNKSSLKFNEKRFATENPALYQKYQEEKAGARILKVK